MSDSPAEITTDPCTREQFIKHLEYSKKVVETWPQWKQGLLGGESKPPKPTPLELQLSAQRLVIDELVSVVEVTGKYRPFSASERSALAKAKELKP